MRSETSSSQARNFSESEDDLPRRFGNYLLLDRLAQGGMGEVFLAKHGGLAGIEKICVVKTIRSQYMTDREYVARFIDEARVVVQLSHRNICHVFDVGQTNGQYYLAMEFIPGWDLRTVQRRFAQLGQRLPVGLVLHTVCEILEALDYAHRHDDPLTGDPLHLVHRDVSPQNVMINFEGEVKLIDFGLAASKLKVERTQPKIVMGKLAYMAPEQARSQTLDGRTDLYAAAIVCYEMLVNDRYYEEKSIEDIWQYLDGTGSPPRLWHEIDPELQQILQRALANRPEERYATCADFRDALEAYQLNHKLRVGAREIRNALFNLFPEARDAHRDLLARANSISSIPILEPVVTPQLSTSIAVARGVDSVSNPKPVPTLVPPINGKPKTTPAPMPAVAVASSAAIPTSNQASAAQIKPQRHEVTVATRRPQRPMDAPLAPAAGTSALDKDDEAAILAAIKPNRTLWYVAGTAIFSIVAAASFYITTMKDDKNGASQNIQDAGASLAVAVAKKSGSPTVTPQNSAPDTVSTPQGTASASYSSASNIVGEVPNKNAAFDGNTNKNGANAGNSTNTDTGSANNGSNLATSFDKVLDKNPDKVTDKTKENTSTTQKTDNKVDPKNIDKPDDKKANKQATVNSFCESGPLDTTWQKRLQYLETCCGGLSCTSHARQLRENVAKDTGNLTALKDLQSTLGSCVASCREKNQ